MKRGLAFVLILPLLGMPASADDGVQQESVRQLKTLNEAVAEMLDLLRARADREARTALVTQLHQLDLSITVLDDALREVLRERETAAKELAELRNHLRQAQGTTSEVAEILKNFQIYSETLREQITEKEARLAHLDARRTELQDALRRRRAERDRVEAEFQVAAPRTGKFEAKADTAE